VERFLGRFAPPLYAILRIIAGLMFLLHGTQKILGWPGGKGGGGPLPLLPTIAGWLEMILGLLIAIGLFGSFAAFLASGEMAVAYFKAHAPQAFWPIVNEGELAVLYCFLFLYIAAAGSGIWSVDAARKGMRPHVG
jgi:putative oxidoreductase